MLTLATPLIPGRHQRSGAVTLAEGGGGRVIYIITHCISLKFSFISYLSSFHYNSTK